MAFASIHVPDFPVQAFVRGEPELRGMALALIEGTAPLESVVALNAAAARAGIRTGMTKSQAEQFVTVEIRRRSRGQEQAAHAALLDLGWSISPRVEDTAADAILLDLAGLSSLFGSEENLAQQLTERAAKLGLLVHVAVAGNPEAALHAARGFGGITVIPAGEEAKRLRLLPVQVLSPPEEILEIFESWGVRTYEAVAQLPVVELSERLGQAGVHLHELARGANARSLVLAEPEVSFREQIELDDSVEELEPLAFLLGRLLDQTCARLAARSLAASAIHLQFTLDTSATNERNLNGERLSAGKKTPKAFHKTMGLPVPIRDSKLLLKLLRLYLQSDPPPAPITGIVLIADPARPRTTQHGLFQASYPDPEKLGLTMARLAHLVGAGNVGSPQLSDTHRPDAFQMERFEPEKPKTRRRARPVSEGQRKRDSSSVTKRPPRNDNRMPNPGNDADSSLQTKAPTIGFRVFRPPIAARVETRAGQPVRITFRGSNGDVVRLSGPWRSAGEWWQESAWDHDEWDVEIRWHNQIENGIARKEPQRGIYRIFYDAIHRRWFARGMYD